MLELHDVDGYYRGHSRVLRGVRFRVPAGQLVALVGPNAAGKTTVVRALAGRIRITGRVTWQGRDITSLGARRRARILAVVPQSDGAPPPHFTVEQTVLLGRTPYLPWWGALREDDIRAVRAALRRLHLSDLAHKPLSALSGGERQRVFLARALAQETPVLVLDEPTAHLDWRAQLEVLEVARAQARSGLAVLMVLHDLNLAARFADHVVLLHQGRVVSAGSPRAVLTPARVAQVYGVDVAALRHNDHLYLVPRRPVARPDGVFQE